MKKNAYTIFLLIAGAALFLCVGFFAFENTEITKRDPVSGLSYRAARVGSFVPLVSKLSANEIAALTERENSVSQVKQGVVTFLDRTVSPRLVGVFSKETNPNGIAYTFMNIEECYKDHVVSLDETANAGKQLIDCSDTYGSQQDRYYVHVGSDVYLFTTPFPTRILYHDPHLDILPQIISTEDFKTIINSLEL